MQPDLATVEPRTHVREAFQHRAPAVLPYQWDMVPAVRDAVDARLGGPRWRESLTVFLHGTDFPFPHRADRPDGTYVDAYGAVWESSDIQHLVQPALAEPSLEGLAWPDVDALWNAHADRMRQQLAEHPERYKMAGFDAGLFERAWALRGFAETLMDMAADPAFATALFDAILEHQLRIVEKLVTLDVDAIWFSDDWGHQHGSIMGPGLWRRYIKPRQARLNELVHRAGKKAIQHCCGSVMELLPEIVEIGVDGLHPVQPEANDPFAVKRQFGRDLLLWGGGPSQSLIPFGTPAAIRDRFRRLREVLGADGGYICAPSKTMLDETPVDNAIATVEGVSGRRSAGHDAADSPRQTDDHD